MASSELTPSSLYTLKKEQLQEELTHRNLSSEGNVEELRKRLSQALKQEKATQENDDQFEMAEEDPTSQDQTPPETPAIRNRPVPTSIRLSDGEIMDKVRKWNVKFDKGQDPLAFLERVEELAACYEIPVKRLFRTLPELLTKNALAWYRNNRENWSGWDDFERDFKSFFLPPRYHVRLAEEIRTKVQKNGEKAKDFITAIQSLMRWQTGMTAEQKLERIYDNLRPEYRFYIRRHDFEDLATLIKLAEEFELLKAEEQRAHRPPVERNWPTERNRALPIKEGYSRSECCWRCGQRGHRKAQCKNPPILFCSRCGKRDVLSRDCPCPRETTRSNQPQAYQMPNPENRYQVPAMQGSRAPPTKPLPVTSSLATVSTEGQTCSWYQNKIKSVSEDPSAYPDYVIRDNQLYKRIYTPTSYDEEDSVSSWKLCVPKPLRERVLRENHDDPTAGHGGISKTICRIAKYYYWPGMFRDIARYVKSCDSCLRHKTLQQKTAGEMHSTTANEPWEIVSVDFMGPFPRSSRGNTMLIVFQDKFTKWVELVAIREATAPAVIKAFRERIFARYGSPTTLISDNGRQFTSHQFQKCLKELHIQHRLTPPYTPQANPVERTNRVIKGMIRQYVDHDQKKWDEKKSA